MFPFDSTPSIELVKPSANGGRLCRLSVVGNDLVTESGAAGKALNASVKSFSTAQEARAAWDKAFHSKLRDDFAVVRPIAETPVGSVVLCAFASGAGAGTLLDLSPDGRFAVTVCSDAKLTRYQVEVIEVASGARRCVFEHTDPTTQNFVHAVFFDATGGSIYLAPRGETLRIDLATGAAARIAGYNEYADARFNPHVLRPHADQRRQRFVVFDVGTHVRVLDRADRVLLSVCAEAPSLECRAARISPSGRLLAIYRASRDIHDPQRDTRNITSVVDVWDVDAGALRTSLSMRAAVDAVGFSPDDTALLVTEYYAMGPIAYDLATGVERWRLVDDARPDELARSHAWDFSPDGKLLAVGHGVTVLYDAATRARIPLEAAGLYRTPAVRFSADGGLLASAEHNLGVVRRVR